MHLNVGVYGYTGAGKTTCISTLLRGLAAANRLNKPNKATERFLSTTAAEAAGGGADPTEKAISGLSFECDSVLGASKLRFTLRDVPGLELAKAADAVVNGKEPEAFEEQLASCNAFLFFFNPIPPEGMDAQAHREREALRARALIDYVVANRENRYLPIVFVITMRDAWGDNLDFHHLVERWQDDVMGDMRRTYADGLAGHYPLVLTDPQDCFARIDCRFEDDVVGAFERLVRLRRRSDEFVRSDKRRVTNVAIGALLLMLLMVGSVTALAFADAGDGGPDNVLNAPSDQDIRSMDEPELLKRLDAIEAQLAQAEKISPTGTTHAQAKQLAESLSDAVRWLPAKLDMIAHRSQEDAAQESDENEDEARGVIGEEAQKSAQATLGRLLEYVRKTVSNAEVEGANQRLVVADLYIDEVDRSRTLAPSLKQGLERYAALSRAALIESSGELLVEARDSSRRAAATYVDLRDLFDNATAKAQGNDVLAGIESWQAYLSELRTAASFCRERADDRAYALNVRVLDGTMLRGASGISKDLFRLWFGPVSAQTEAIERAAILTKGGSKTGGYAIDDDMDESDQGPANLFSLENETNVRLLDLNGHADRNVTPYASWVLDWNRLELPPAPVTIPGLPALDREDIAEDGSGFSFEMELGEQDKVSLYLRLSGAYVIPPLLWEAVDAANSQSAP